MITDEELSELPADPELAFVQFERILRARLQLAQEQAANQEVSADRFELEYMNKVAAAAKIYNIESLEGLTVAKLHSRSGSFYDYYRQFIQDVDHVTIQIRIRSAQSNRQGSVSLNDVDKTKIHHFIAQIRGLIAEADLPEDKRDALYNKLNKFAAEVDKKRTALQTGMAVYISICDMLGQGFNKLEPARKWIDSVGALLGHVKDFEDNADHRLSPPAERKRLEPPPPKKRVQSSPSSNKVRELQIDDDIPF